MRIILVTRSESGCKVAIPVSNIIVVDDQGSPEKPSTWITLCDGKNYCVRESVVKVANMMVPATSVWE